VQDTPHCQFGAKGLDARLVLLNSY
jgi:hypothetical protein